MDSENKPDEPAPETLKKAYYEVAKDSKGRWHWVMWSKNGRQLATNVIDYEKQRDAINAIGVLKEACATASDIVKGQPE